MEVNSKSLDVSFINSKGIVFIEKCFNTGSIIVDQRRIALS